MLRQSGSLPTRLCVQAVSVTLSLLFLASADIGAAQDSGLSLKQMSLEDLGNLEVTTVGKGPEELRRTPAAIHVITQEDIRRSGATTLAEVLRLAPGLAVSRIDNGHWAVGVRGFGDQFSKAVLLLIDGRSVYTPLYGGVFWGFHGLILDDIDRIEVIRGPGGTIWGANAVNGVINVVTKHASATEGVKASLITGNVDHVLGQVRYGGRRGRLDYRVYGSGTRRGPQAGPDADAYDDWSLGQGGGRLDWTGDRDELTVQGDLFSTHVGQRVAITTFVPPMRTVHTSGGDIDGGNVTAAWRRRLRNGADLQLRGYIDRTYALAPQLEEIRHTFDVDFTHRLAEGSRHRILWGAGARYSPSTFTPTVETVTMMPPDRANRIFSAFVQDEIALAPDRWMLAVGSKIEHHTYVGLEVQPSVRLLWTPTPRQSLWAAVTRAVRTPARLERDFTVYALPDPSRPVFAKAIGTENFDSERHESYEVGYRQTVHPRLYLDAAVFLNRHRALMSFGEITQAVEPTPPPARLVFTVPIVNGVEGTSAGLEVSPSWTPTAWWQLRGTYAHLRLDLRNQPGNTDVAAVATYEGSSPRHQVRVESLMALPHEVELDLTLRRVSALPARDVEAYTAVNVRLGWQFTSALELSLSGQNLGGSHLEFEHNPAPSIPIARAVALRIVWTR
jgi:iron complex outermembrane receptor protein